MLGMTLQTESCSTSVCTPASEDFRMSLPCLFLLNHGTGLGQLFWHRSEKLVILFSAWSYFSQLFQAQVETSVPVLSLDDY